MSQGTPGSFLVHLHGLVMPRVFRWKPGPALDPTNDSAYKAGAARMLEEGTVLSEEWHSSASSLSRQRRGTERKGDSVRILCCKTSRDVLKQQLWTMCACTVSMLVVTAVVLFVMVYIGSKVEVYTSIHTGTLDTREYRGIVMPNGLIGILVHDPATNQSGAAMDVSVGTSSNPSVLPGLAHLCEHMLFAGTTRHPTENSFQTWAEEHGGSTNAFTAIDHTEYYFNVNSDYFEEALSRFSEMFWSPLFSTDDMPNVVDAVDSENSKNLLQDGWRIDQMRRSESSPDHPYHKFPTGNKNTLEKYPSEQGIDVHLHLVGFLNTHYTGNRMVLTVYGKEDLNTLQKYVESFYWRMSNVRSSTPDYSELPRPYSTSYHGKGQLGTWYNIVPISHMRRVIVHFPLPSFQVHYQYKPMNYITSLLGHEGSGSLLSKLKAQNLATGIVAEAIETTGDFDLMAISIDLSVDGEENVDDVVSFLFQYVRMLQASGVKEWYGNEIAKVLKMEFDYQEQTDLSGYVRKLSRHAHLYGAENAVYGPYDFDYSAKILKEVIDLMGPESSFVYHISKKFDGSTLETEKWYGTAFTRTVISEEKVNEWKTVKIDSDLRMPPVNPYIAETFEIKDGGSVDEPILIRNSTRGNYYYKSSQSLKVPRAVVAYRFNNPLMYSSPKNAVLAKLYVKAILAHSHETVYLGRTAKLFVSVACSSVGMDISFYGYNDKLLQFSHDVFELMASFNASAITYSQFSSMHTELKDEAHNFPRQPVFEVQDERITTMVEKPRYDPEFNLAAALNTTTQEELVEYSQGIFDRMFVRGLLYGNINEDDVNNFVDTLHDGIRFVPLPYVEESNPSTVLVSGDNLFVSQNVNEGDSNSGAFSYYQLGPATAKNVALCALLEAVVSPSFYNQLRSKEALGYVVQLSMMSRQNTIGIGTVVMGTTVDPSMMTARADQFFKSYESTIQSINDQTFLNIKTSTASALEQTPYNLKMWAQSYWDVIIRTERMGVVLYESVSVNRTTEVPYNVTYVNGVETSGVWSGGDFFNSSGQVVECTDVANISQSICENVTRSRNITEEVTENILQYNDPQKGYVVYNNVTYRNYNFTDNAIWTKNVVDYLKRVNTFEMWKAYHDMFVNKDTTRRATIETFGKDFDMNSPEVVSSAKKYTTLDGLKETASEFYSPHFCAVNLTEPCMWASVKMDFDGVN